MADAAALLRVVGVRKAFGGIQAVDGVSFDLPCGEIRALIGPNGAGKSTFFNILTGQLRKEIMPVLEDLPIEEKVRMVVALQKTTNDIRRRGGRRALPEWRI